MNSRLDSVVENVLWQVCGYAIQALLPIDRDWNTSTQHVRSLRRSNSYDVLLLSDMEYAGKH